MRNVSSTEKTSPNEDGGDGQLVALEPYNGFGLLQLSAEEELHSYVQQSSTPEVCLDPRELWFVWCKLVALKKDLLF